MAVSELNLAVNQRKVALNNRLFELLGFIDAPILLVQSLYVDIAKKLNSIKQSVAFFGVLLGEMCFYFL